MRRAAAMVMTQPITGLHRLRFGAGFSGSGAAVVMDATSGPASTIVQVYIGGGGKRSRPRRSPCSESSFSLRGHLEAVAVERQGPAALGRVDAEDVGLIDDGPVASPSVGGQEISDPPTGVVGEGLAGEVVDL